MSSPNILLGAHWATELREHFKKGRHLRVSQGKLYCCDPRSSLWIPHTIDEARRLASEFIDAQPIFKIGAKAKWHPVVNTRQNRAEIVNSLLDDNTLVDEDFFSDASPGFAAGQDFISVTPLGIIRTPLLPDHRARASLAFNMPIKDPGEPGVFLESLGRVFGTDEDGHAKIACFQEFLGACRIGTVTNYERAIIMPGGGSNGKSTIIMGAVEALFNAPEWKSIVPNFMNQEYYLMQVRDIAINVVTELPKEQINCTERFKQIISGEDVTGRPIKEMPVTFRPRAGHIFACNNFPRLSDNSKGMWRRILVLRADSKFTKSEGLRTDIVEQFKAEAPQILVWALVGAQRLMQRGDYSFPQSHFAEEEQWRGSNDKALQFVNNCTKGFDSGWSKAAVIHKLFLEWYAGMGYGWNDRLDPAAFGAALKHIDGFKTKRQSYGMAYNFVTKSRDKWVDYHEGTSRDSGEVELEKD